MATNHRDRRDRERDRDDGPRKQPYKESVRSDPPLGEYFLDGDGIDRQVLQSCICRFLGPEATCKPYEHEGRPGYKIRAVRAFTPEMLHDLRERSREYVSENTARKMGNRDEVSYEASQTRSRKDAPPDMEMDMDYPPRSRGPLSPPGPAMGYTAPYMPDPPMPYGYSAAYSQSYAYPGIPTSVGPSAAFPQRGYGNEPSYGYPTSRDGPLGPTPMPYGYPLSQGGYGDSSRMGPDGYVFPAEPPRAMEHMRDTRDLRDPRDTRDPRDIRDPRDLRDIRAVRDPREMRDTRDPRYGMHDPMSGIQAGPSQHRDARDPRDPRTSGQYDQPPRDLYNRPSQRR